MKSGLVYSEPMCRLRSYIPPPAVLGVLLRPFISNQSPGIGGDHRRWVHQDVFIRLGFAVQNRTEIGDVADRKDRDQRRLACGYYYTLRPWETWNCGAYNEPHLGMPEAVRRAGRYQGYINGLLTGRYCVIECY
jgi:hypothetical protein